MSELTPQQGISALEALTASDGWTLLRTEFVNRQLSLSREMVGGIDDFTKYRESAAEHRQIGTILNWPVELADALRKQIDQEEGTA